MKGSGSWAAGKLHEEKNDTILNMKTFLFIVLLSLSINARFFTQNGDIAAKKNVDYMGIHIIDQKKLSFNKIEGVPFGGISDLTYVPDTGTLYMVSDRGRLFSFDASFGRRIRLHPTHAASLRDSNGTQIQAINDRDTEGMTRDGKGHVLLSFEEHPRIARIGVRGSRFGQLLPSHYPLPSDLKDPKYYVNGNRQLEAVVWHPKYGLLTAAENPTTNHHDGFQRIYSLSGKVWAFRPETERNTGIVSMAVMDDGNLLVLERAFIRWNYPFVVTLKKVYLNHKKGYACHTKILAKMDIHTGWWVDNYEGLTKVGKNRYVMISDDDYKYYRPTLMMYFEVR